MLVLLLTSPPAFSRDRKSVAIAEAGFIEDGSTALIEAVRIMLRTFAGMAALASEDGFVCGVKRGSGESVGMANSQCHALCMWCRCESNAPPWQLRQTPGSLRLRPR